MCRIAKHLQQLHAYSQNTLNDTHTYKGWGEHDDGPTDSRYIYIAIRFEHK